MKINLMITSKLAKQLCIDMTYSSHTSNNNSYDGILTEWFGDIFEYGGIIAVYAFIYKQK